jgi:hypothetical protein
MPLHKPTFEPDEDDPYAMANLRPATTGLPMVVWVSERGNARHDVRLKVCQVLGDRMQFNNTLSVAVRPQPHLVPGQRQRLTDADLHAVYEWIALNEAAIVDYWDGTIDTAELVQRLRRLP